MGSIADIFFKAQLDDKQFAKDIERSATKAGEQGAKGLSSKFKGAFKDLGPAMKQGLGIGVGLGAFSLVAGGVSMVTDAIGSAVSAAEDFDASLRTINTVAGVSDEQLQAIGDDIQALAKETGQTTDDLSQGFYDLVSAGVPAEHAMEVLKQSAILATGALSTTGEAVDLLTTTLNAYGMEATEAERITDIFAKTVADGKVTAAELGATMSDIAPLAASAGVEIEEVAAGFAEMTAQGTPAAKAATQMKNAISSLLTPNEALNKIQKETNTNFAEMARSDGLAATLEVLREAAGSEENFAKALGSVDALQFALAATGENAAAMQEEIVAMGDSAGTAQGQFDEMAKSAEFRNKQLEATLQVVMQDLGAMILPIKEMFVGAIQTAIEVVDNLADAWHNVERAMNATGALAEDVEGRIREVAEARGLDAQAVIDHNKAVQEGVRLADAERAAEDRRAVIRQKITDAEGRISAALQIRNDRERDTIANATDLTEAQKHTLQTYALLGEAQETDLRLTATGTKLLNDRISANVGIQANMKEIQTLSKELSGVTVEYTADVGENAEAIAEADRQMLAYQTSLAGVLEGERMAANAALQTGEDLGTLNEAVAEAAETSTATWREILARNQYFDAWNAAWTEPPFEAPVKEALGGVSMIFEDLFGQGVGKDMRNQVRRDFEQILEDIEFMLTNPNYWSKLGNRIRDRLDSMNRQLEKAERSGNTRRANTLRAGISVLEGFHEDHIGWTYRAGERETRAHGRGINDASTGKLSPKARATEVKKGVRLALYPDVPTLKGYGADTIQAYIDGMSSKEQAAVDVAKNIPGLIGDILGNTGSPPRNPLNPLHHIDKWGADTAQAYLDGFASVGSAGQIASMLPAMTTSGGSLGSIGLTNGVVRHEHHISNDSARNLVAAGYPVEGVAQMLRDYRTEVSIPVAPPGYP